MSDNKTEFEEVVREQSQVKNIPNAEFGDGVFHFADYFDIEAFKESFEGDVDDEDSWAEWAFEPYEMYFAGIPEIETSENQDEMYWFNVTVEIPADTGRQALLAALISDAVKQRQQR